MLISQLTDIIDRIDLDRSEIKKKLEAEADENYSVKDADIRNYAKYLLTEGSMFEKRDLLTCLKSKIVLQGKRLAL